MGDVARYRSESPLTGDESRVTEVSELRWPTLLDPQDDLPPITVITHIKPIGPRSLVRGVSHDNGEITSVIVNGQPATLVRTRSGVVDWQVELDTPADHLYTASGRDQAGNTEAMAHRFSVRANSP